MTPDDEAARLARLHALGVLDTPAEALFDTFTHLAAQVCGTPIALVSLIDAERQWFKSAVGLEGVRETPRELAFCAHAIKGDALMEVPDARFDPRFAGNALVTGSPHIRFYAGAPIAMPGGERIGTLCVIDRQARVLDDGQRRLLNGLAQGVREALLLREQTLSSALQARSRLETELREQVAALDLSERKLKKLSESSPFGVYHADADGGCTYTNARWQHIYGLDAAQSAGQGWTSTLHPDDRAAVFATWQACTTAGSEFDMAFRVRRPDGESRRVRSRARAVRDAHGGINGWVGAVEDVTERSLAEERLRASEAFLDRTGRIANVGGWALEIGSNELTWSDQTRRIHEVASHYQPTLQDAVRFYTPESQLLIDAAARNCMNTGAPWDLELALTTATGRAIWVRAQGEPEYEGGRLVRLLGAFQDITEQRQRKAELQREQSLRRQLETHALELDRLLRERGEMLDVLAHEVRQPLNNASAALQSAAAVLDGVGEGVASVRLSRAQAVLGRVTASIDNTLAVASLLAGPAPLTYQDTDIDTFTAVVLADLPAAERHRIGIERATGTRTASMDMGLMRLALRNLLANALAYSPAGSRVTVTLADQDEPPALVIDVADQGDGFAAELLPRLFTRGARGSRTQGARGTRGHGLGLYIVRRVMELHGGRIELLRNSRQGATLRLVVAQAAVDAAGT